jgi:signal transduction histidine kinase
MVSHELKTPLTSIKGYVQLLEMVVNGSQTKEFVDRVLIQVNKLDGLVNDLLDISKIENGKLKFELEEVDFGKLLSSTIEMLRLIYPDTKIIHNHAVNASIKANAIRLEQVLINFISNAVKYSPKNNEVEVITEITDENKLFVGVKDWGIGISPEKQPNIFGKFYRVSEASKYAQGLGIGLYICSEILQRHNADFGVESEYGKGSLFYFKIPVISNN